MSTLALEIPAGPEPGSAPERFVVRLEELGELMPLGRPGGQGRVYRPTCIPAKLGAAPVVVKLYRRPPSATAVEVLVEMIAWSWTLHPDQRAHLQRVAAWPLAIITAGADPVGIAMHDVSGRFEVPFVMPSGRRQPVLLSLEHLLGGDDYLHLRGLGIRLDTTMRTEIAEQITGTLAFLHRHGILASDIAPNNLLVGFGASGPAVCFIDCDSMVFHGRQALAPVETADWQMPPEAREPPRTRATDAYKLGLVVLRLFSRSHDARLLTPHIRHVPSELRELVSRSLSSDAVNRPPAGEWQRALRQVLIAGALTERYPGPAPTPVLASRPAASTRHRHDPSPPPPAAPAGRASQGRPRQGKASQPLALAWLVLAAVIFALMLARLLAAAGPSVAGSGFGSSGGGRGNAPYQYYYAPSGPGSGTGFR